MIFGPVTMNVTNDITVAGDFTIDGNVTAGGDITVDRTFSLPGLATAGGSFNLNGFFGKELDAGQNITFADPNGGSPNIFIDTIVAGGNLNLVNVAAIQNDTSTGGVNTGGMPFNFSLTAGDIIGSGATRALLQTDGFGAEPTVANDNPGNASNITIDITAGSLTIGSAGDLSEIHANGGAFASDSTAGGDGGVIDITASGDVTLQDGNLSASSGLNSTGVPLGAGGTVNITTGGAITVNSVIQTSDNGSGGRNSARGGNIHLTSNRASGTAINISNSGQLLAILDQAAPGPGGTITILATGSGGSSVTVDGGVEADKGRVDIRHTGAGGIVNLGNATSSVTLNGDVVKAGALGANGVLNVGQGSLSADSVLKLYAPSSNGTLNFVGSVNLSSGTDTILAANTITIQPTVVVTVAGNGGPAQVFTNNPNYSGSGGTNANNGTFAGNGANNPLPLSQAPAFDGPPGG